jgi:DnaJ-class molecular chaperone
MSSSLNLNSYAPEICAFCNSTGESDGRRCPACCGKGEVMVAQPAKRCGLCNGTGRLCIRGCPACGGTGWTGVLKG